MQMRLHLFINFVRQEPTTAYTASGTSLTLTSATSASDDMYCVFLGKAVQTVNPPSGSVGISQLSATGTKDSTTFLRGDNTFATVSSPGLNLIKSQTASSAASVEFVNGSSGVVFDSTYPLYYLIGYGIYNSTSVGEPEIHITTDTGSTYKTTGYKTIKRRLFESGGSVGLDGTGVSTDHIGGSFLSVGTDSTYPTHFQAYFWNPSATTRPKVYSQWNPSSSTYNGYTIMQGMYNTSTSYDGFRIEPNAGTINGTFKLYGVTA
jgi:hypothetical protein